MNWKRYREMIIKEVMTREPLVVTKKQVLDGAILQGDVYVHNDEGGVTGTLDDNDCFAEGDIVNAVVIVLPDDDPTLECYGVCKVSYSEKRIYPLFEEERALLGRLKTLIASEK